MIYIIFFLLALAFFYPFLTGVNILSFRDLSLYFYPLRFLMVDMVKSGQLPLWNPYIFCGYPLMATLQVGFFYPLSLIHYVLPFNLAFNYYTILHYFMGALFMYWLMRYFSLSRSSSFLSALIFAFSGYMLSMANMNTTLTSVIWIPLILLFYDRLVVGGDERPACWVSLGVLFALQFLGGEPTVIYVTSLFLLVYGLVLGKPKLKSVAALALPLLIAGGLVAVQLFPFLEVVRDSLRMVRTDYSFISFKSFPPREIINFIFPYFFGNPLKGSYTQILVGDRHQTWMLSPYVGILPLIFSFFSFRRGDKRIWLFWGAILFSFLMAFGRFTPFYWIAFKMIPGISSIRYPVKYIFLVFFIFSALCGFGFERVQEMIKQGSKKLGRWVFALGSLFVLVGLIGLGVIFNPDWIFPLFRKLFSQNLSAYYVKIIRDILFFNISSLRNLTMVLFLGVCIFYLTYKKVFRSGIFGILILTLILADLALNNIGINPPGSYAIFKNTTPNVQILQKDKDLFRFYAAPPDKGQLPPEYKSHNENLYRTKDGLLPNWAVPCRIASLLGRESIEPAEFTVFYRKHKDQLLYSERSWLNTANVKYILWNRDLEGMEIINVENYKDGTKSYLLMNPHYQPRARIKGRPGSKCDIIEYSENEVEIEASLPRKGMLFLGDAYFPGWKVYVDNKEGKILKVNRFFRGVNLEEGDHKLRFVYDPLSFKFGAVISLFTIFGLAVSWFLFIKGKK